MLEWFQLTNQGDIVRRNLMRAGAALVVLAAVAGCSSSEETSSSSNGRMGPGGGDAQIAAGEGAGAESDTPSEVAEEGVENGEAVIGTPVPGDLDPNREYAPEPGYVPAAPPGDEFPLPYDDQPADGARTWAVYTALADDIGAPALQQSADQLTALGYGPFTAIVKCDTGAAAALGLDENQYRTGLYFASEADARAFSAQYGGPTVGIAQVTATCQDD